MLSFQASKGQEANSVSDVHETTEDFGAGMNPGKFPTSLHG
jgi:hypothetical protein